MKKWNTIATAQTPDGKEMVFCERDGEYVIRVAGIELMSSKKSVSEKALADFGCENLGENARVLIGGLGLGFTLQRACELLPDNAHIVVAEIIPEVVEWVSRKDLPLAHAATRDPRVTLLKEDVFRALESLEAFDAILLDVDNGPAALTTSNNANLYQPIGLQKFRQALKVNGRLLVWSVEVSPLFEKNLNQAGFSVEIRRIAKRAIYLARRK